jgi:hypothetical protein
MIVIFRNNNYWIWRRVARHIQNLILKNYFHTIKKILKQNKVHAFHLSWKEKSNGIIFVSTCHSCNSSIQWFHLKSDHGPGIEFSLYRSVQKFFKIYFSKAMNKWENKLPPFYQCCLTVRKYFSFWSWSI